jgi:hypothetical protein
MRQSGITAIGLGTLFFLLIGGGVFGASFPKEKLPGHTRLLIDRGERVDWSLDGKKLLYVTKAGGEVYEYDLETGENKPISTFDRASGVGFYRCNYLANGDYFLTGGKDRRSAYIYILDKSLTQPPHLLYEMVAEGPAISRTQMKVIWTPEQHQIFIGDIVYEKGVPRIANKTLLIDWDHTTVEGVTYGTGEHRNEPQNFIGPEETSFTWSQYTTTPGGVFSAETMTYDLETGAMENHSHRPDYYDEPEGIFPAGDYTLVENDNHKGKGSSAIDLYRMKLDGTGKDMLRLTHFSDLEDFKAGNGVVSDDGRFLAFHEGRSSAGPGDGFGIYVMDLEKAGIKVKVPEPAARLALYPCRRRFVTSVCDVTSIEPVRVRIENHGIGTLKNVRASGSAAWLKVDHTPADGNQQTLTIGIDPAAESLAAGEHKAYVTVEADNAKVRRIPVILEITDSKD